MVRITKKQEFDELSKFGCAFLQTNNYGGYCIVGSVSNIHARVILKPNHVRI